MKPQPVSRRRFIRSGGVAALGVAAVPLGAGSAVADGRSPALAAAQPDSISADYYPSGRVLAISVTGHAEATAVNVLRGGKPLAGDRPLTGAGDHRVAVIDNLDASPGPVQVSLLDKDGISQGTAAIPSRSADVWRPFDRSSPWNTVIADSPQVDDQSDAMVNELAYGGLLINLPAWSVPVYEVSGSYRTVDVYANRHEQDGTPIAGPGFEQEPTKVPIPDGALGARPRTPWDGYDGDMHLAVIDRRRGIEWGMWRTKRGLDGMIDSAPPDAWSTGLGAVTDLTGTGVRPTWKEAAQEGQWQLANGARASGFPLIAGLIRPEEIIAGEIPHALVFAYPRLRSEYFQPPASTSQVKQLQATHYRGIPVGGRIQLDPDLDVGGLHLTRTGKIIARALQRYGAYCGDYAGATVLYADSSPSARAAWQGLLSYEPTISLEISCVMDEPFIRSHFRVLKLNPQRGQNWADYPDPGPFPP